MTGSGSFCDSLILFLLKRYSELLGNLFSTHVVQCISNRLFELDWLQQLFLLSLQSSNLFLELCDFLINLFGLNFGLSTRGLRIFATFLISSIKTPPNFCGYSFYSTFDRYLQEEYACKRIFALRMTLNVFSAGTKFRPLDIKMLRTTVPVN